MLPSKVSSETLGRERRDVPASETPRAVSRAVREATAERHRIRDRAELEAAARSQALASAPRRRAPGRQPTHDCSAKLAATVAGRSAASTHRPRLRPAALGQVPTVTTFDLRRFERDVRARLTDWRGVLDRQTTQARQIPAEATGGAVGVPGSDSEGRYYEFAGQGALDKLLTGVIRPSSVVTSAGFARSWSQEVDGELEAVGR